MPEIVVFKSAKPVFILSNNPKNGSVFMNKNKLQMHEIRRIFL